MKSRKWLFAAVSLLCGIAILGSSSTTLARRKKDKKSENAQPAEAVIDSAKQARKHLSFGDRYLRNKQYEDAEAQLTKAWSFDPTNAKVAYRIGKLYNALEKFDEAISWFKKTLEMGPESKSVEKNICFFLSQIYTLQEDRPGAIWAYEALLELASDPDMEVQYLRYLMALYAEEDDYEAALKYARRWGELEPDNAEAQDTIAKLALYTGEEDEALAQMEKVLEMNPEDYATLDKCANMYRQRGDLEKAFSGFERLHAHDPQNYLYLDYLLELGDKLHKPSRFRTQILKKMLKLQPENLSVIEQLADATGSMRIVNQGLRLDPGNGKLNYLKGDFYYKSWKKTSAPKDSVNALRWFAKAKRDPQWRGNAQRMINEINPPLTAEQKKKLEFFKKKDKEEVNTTGKK